MITMRDRRSKGCPNPQCDRNKEKFRYKASDAYCTHCGGELVFVCEKCFGPIEDAGPNHRRCPRCQAKIDDRADKRRDNAQKAVGGVMAVGTAVAALIKVDAPKKVAKAVAQVVKYIPK
jgi:hypothetical protein